MVDVVSDVVINYKSVGLDKVGADIKATSVALDGLVVSSATAVSATTSLENKFQSLSKTTTAYTTVLSEARGAALGLAAGIGPVGAVLGSFGPWGVAAAAGIGLVSNAMNYMRENAEKVGDTASSLKLFADNAGLTITQVRGLNEAAGSVGISSDRMSASVEKFTVNFAEARKAGGDLYDQLNVIDRGLAADISNAKDTASAFDVLIKALNSTTDATTKAAIARAAVGKDWQSLVQVAGVIGDAGGIDRYSDAVKNATGLTDEWFKNVAKLRNEIKSTEEEAKLVFASIYTPEVLAAQKTFADQQLAIAQAFRESIKAQQEGSAPATPFGMGMVDEFGRQIGAEQLTNPSAAKGAPGTSDQADRLNAAFEALNGTIDQTPDKVDKIAEAAGRLRDRVNDIANSWGDVDRATALALQSMQNQLPVLQAINGQQRMAAQAAADYANYIDAGKSELEASSLAAAKLEAAQASATSSVKQQVESLKDSTEMIKAQQNGTEATTAAAIAYKNAIESGASSTSAAALSAATLENRMAGAAAQTQQMAQAAADAEVALENTARASKTAADFARASTSAFAPDTMPSGQHSIGGVPGGIFYKGGGTGIRLSVGSGFAPASGPLSVPSIPDFAGFAKQIEEFAHPKTDDLKNSIDDLKTSTDSLTATNQELLSPYYTQDPRTSHIGFRSQGMASGGYVDVPGGISSNDNMIATVPVASGERIYIDPMSNRRGSSGGGGGMVINISSPINIYGNADKDQFGRTVYQANQQLAKQVRAATQ